MNHKTPIPPFRAACVQYAASADVAENLTIISQGIDQAAQQGADLVQLPEMANLMQPDKTLARQSLTCFGSDIFLEALRDLALDHKVWLHVGSLIVPKQKHFRNRGFLINAGGEIIGQYDKIHLFDVTLKNGESYRESDHYKAGNKAVVLPTPWGNLGMTICFDLRFSDLYSRLVDAGANILSAPAAFTLTTGTGHWHTLVRSRAIEFGAPMIAANQGGQHAGGLKTFGHSLIIDAWGRILAEGSGEGFQCIVATIDPTESAKVRQMIPKQKLRQSFEVSA